MAKSKAPACQTPRAALEKLKVDSGGRGSTEPLCDGLFVSLNEGPPDSGVPYQTSVLFGSRRSTVALSKDDVFTKGKSMWRRDNRWRLTPQAIDRLEPQLAALIEKIPKKP